MQYCRSQVKRFYRTVSDVIERSRRMKPERRPLCSAFMRSSINDSQENPDHGMLGMEARLQGVKQ